MVLAISFSACKKDAHDEQETSQTEQSDTAVTENNRVDRFADVQVLQYKVPGFDKLNNKQKELVYYLTQAALSGRDIIYAQNYKHNIQIRRVLEQIYTHYSGDRESDEWGQFETYLKRVWFSNGIHHHYSEKKFVPACSQEYFNSLVENCGDKAQWPLLNGQTAEQMFTILTPVMFDPTIDPKKVNKDENADKVLQSANNYYGPNVTEAEALAYYNAMKDPKDTTPISYGLNSRLVKEDGKLKEEVYKVDGRYGSAIQQMVHWLRKASEVAETDAQKKYIDLLVQFYETGDLHTWDECNIQWVNSQDGDVDFIHGFIEVYGDALSYKASYESTIEIKDFEASERMAKLSKNAQWFEDNSTIMEEHKKPNVVGVTYNVVNVAIEAGDCAPSTPIGINLPNANWIRKDHGSKSVSLGNIVQAYNDASGEGTIEEFYLDTAVQARIKKYGRLGGKMHTAMHEVIGHASGKINPGVGTPKETLKNYSSTLEEARADLVALYFLMDEQLVEWGLIPTTDVGKAEYDGYITNGMMTQLRRLEPGENIEEDHMRNRQLVAMWCYEKGKEDNVIEKVEVDGKTYFVINDYDKLRVLFGQLLREIQRIKSEGDYESARALVETYGVKVDQDILAEVKARYEPFDLAPYSGFIQPMLTPVTDENDNITDVTLELQDDFAKQMMRLSTDYSFLPNSGN